MSENLYRKLTAEEIEYERQESKLRAELDMNSLIGEAEDRGLARGRSEGEQLGLERGKAEGVAVGAAQKEREIAKNMKDKQLDFKTILEITGLSLQEIETL